MNDLRPYGDHFASFVGRMREDFDELTQTGSLARAIALTEATHHPFDDDRYPQYFVGDLDAEVVLVHLNPKSPHGEGLHFNSFEDYIDHYRFFGQRMYGVDSEREHKSPFDRKQIRFLRELDVIEFVPETTPDAEYKNLERVIDGKLQLELIPYGSTEFRSSLLASDVIRPYFDQLIEVIVRRPRTHVLFCGAVFEKLVRPFVVADHRFRLTRNDGQLERSSSHFANLAIEHDGHVIQAGWCRSFARQGIPITSYARHISRLYAC